MQEISDRAGHRKRPFYTGDPSLSLSEILVRGSSHYIFHYSHYISHYSHLVSNGFGLQVVGKLLGHVTPSTKQRYAHLSDGSVRDAANKLGGIVLEFERAKRA